MIRNALAGDPLPVYGDGNQVRDWLYVLDHCDAVRTILEKGRMGETYNIGGGSEKKNLDVVKALCAVLDRDHPRKTGSYREQIAFVKDRPGHDRRYAIDGAKLRDELGWQPKESFESGLRKTVQWYLDNGDWLRGVTSGDYRKWISLHYAERAA
jgi:dTDP-glucose 4,6-dehydratase